MTKVDAAIIIQARMGSSRMQGKIVFPLGGRRMLCQVVSRLEFAPVIGPVIIATSTEPADDLICSFTGSDSVSCFRGSEDNVLERFWGAAEHLDNKFIVRATADNPLVWEGAIEYLWDVMKDGDYDYATFDEKLPIGMAVEMFTHKALRIAQTEATDARHREHVTPFIYTQPGRFRCYRATPPEYLWGNYRLTVDDYDDYDLMKIIYDRLYVKDHIIAGADVINMLRQEPYLAKLNMNVHQKSYKE